MKTKEQKYIECRYCGAKILQTHYAQKFCKGDKCRNSWHNEKRAEYVAIGKNQLNGNKDT
jgi:hypothetical protein